MKKLLTIICLLFVLNGYSQTVKKDTDNSLFGFINEWIGRPYKFGGNSEFGIDCSNFVTRLYNKVFNSTISGTCYYLWEQTKRVSFDSLQIGDMIFFNSPLSPSGWHVGVYIGDNQFVHAANRKEGVKISCLSEDYYKKHYKGAGRPF